MRLIGFTVSLGVADIDYSYAAKSKVAPTQEIISDYVGGSSTVQRRTNTAGPIRDMKDVKTPLFSARSLF
jgi:hypothetical protein